MNFDQESKPEDFFFFFWGGGGWRRDRGGGKDSDRNKKAIGICLYLVLILYIKFQVPGSSGSLVLIQTKGERTGKGHNSANVLQNSVNSYLNMYPGQSTEFQYPSSSNFLHIVLTNFFYCYKS